MYTIRAMLCFVVVYFICILRGYFIGTGTLYQGSDPEKYGLIIKMDPPGTVIWT